MSRDMHRNRAWSGPPSCTETVHDVRLNLARFFVQHQHPPSCTAAVQGVLHPRGCINGQPTYVRRYGQPKPSCTGVQDGRIPLPQPDDDTSTQTSRRRNPLTARAEIGMTSQKRAQTTDDNDIRIRIAAEKLAGQICPAFETVDSPRGFANEELNLMVADWFGHLGPYVPRGV